MHHQSDQIMYTKHIQNYDVRIFSNINSRNDLVLVTKYRMHPYLYFSPCSRETCEKTIALYTYSQLGLQVQSSAPLL